MSYWKINLLRYWNDCKRI